MEPKKSSERTNVEALLKRLVKVGQPWPSSIEEGERPDFILQYGEAQVGVETTRSVYQEMVRADKLHQAKCPGEWFITTNLIDGPRRRSDQEILGEMLSNDPAWRSCAQEMRGWRDKIARSLAAKRGRLNQPGFKHFQRNWLLIYDLPGLGNDVFSFQKAPFHIAEIFSSAPEYGLDYDAIFVLSRRYLFRYQNKKIAFNYEPDLTST